MKLCDICLGNEDDETDPLMDCSKCHFSGHASCLMLQAWDDQEKWLCQVCISVRQGSKEQVRCALCPDRNGLMTFIQEERLWVHFTCVNWFNEIYFDEFFWKLNGNLKALTRKRKGTCAICQLTTGKTLNCDSPGCKEQFHVRCARAVGVIRRYDKMAEVGSMIYCLKHLKEEYSEHFDQRKLCIQLQRFPKLFFGEGIDEKAIIAQYEQKSTEKLRKENNTRTQEPEKLKKEYFIKAQELEKPLRNKEKLVPKKKEKAKETQAPQVYSQDFLDTFETNLMLFVQSLRNKVFLGEEDLKEKLKLDKKIIEISKLITSKPKSQLAHPFTILAPFQHKERIFLDSLEEPEYSEEKSQSSKRKPQNKEKESSSADSDFGMAEIESLKIRRLPEIDHDKQSKLLKKRRRNLAVSDEDEEGHEAQNDPVALKRTQENEMNDSSSIESFLISLAPKRKQTPTKPQIKSESESEKEKGNKSQGGQEEPRIVISQEECEVKKPVLFGWAQKKQETFEKQKKERKLKQNYENSTGSQQKQKRTLSPLEESKMKMLLREIDAKTTQLAEKRSSIFEIYSGKTILKIFESLSHLKEWN